MVYYILVGIFSSNLLYHKKDCFPTLLRVVAVFFIARFFTAPLIYHYSLRQAFLRIAVAFLPFHQTAYDNTPQAPVWPDNAERVCWLPDRTGRRIWLASATIKRAIRSYGYGNTHFTLVLPYMKAEYRDNEKEYLDYYDEVEMCDESSEAHPKSAIQVRNRSMIDRADLVVCCIQHKSGGAYRTIQYAEKQGK